MRRWSRALAVLSCSVLVAACDDLGSSVRDAFAQKSEGAAAQTPDRVQQQLGEVPTALDTTAGARLSGSFRAASAHALPAVVHITTVALSENVEFMPGFPEAGPERMQGRGSGFIIDDSGIILTNHHVVRNALNVSVALLDGREFTAEVIGSDPNTDIAVLRINAEDEKLPVIDLGDSDALKVGDWVIALGNPLGLTFTATAGIVSAKNRAIGILNTGANQYPLEAFIQTDAAINPGNSGGPLVDLNGRVIGINTAIESATGFFTGAGFAIPIALARKVADDIIKYGEPHRPRLGVSIQDVNAADAELYKLPSVTGVEINAVTAGTPADQAGLQLGDVIITLNNRPVNTVAELQSRVAQFQPGDRVEVGYIRYGERRQATVQLSQFEVTRTQAARDRVQRAANPIGFRVSVLPPAMAARIGLADETLPVVSSVDPLSPAFNSGLRRGHVIRKFNGRDIRTVRDLERAAGAVRSGQVISVIAFGIDDPQQTPYIFNYRAQ